MPKRHNSGRNPTARELRDADRVAQLHPEQQRSHPATCTADADKLTHINTYGSLPEFYIDKPFTCRLCGKHEIWKAAAQKWYFEEAKGHVDATAVECNACRTQSDE